MTTTQTPDKSPQRSGTLRSRSLRWLLTATAVSSVGDGLVLVALPLMAVALTTNALLISGVVVAARLPWLLVALPAGALVDRAGRRRLTVAVEIGRGVLFGLVALAVLSHNIDLALLYVLAFADGAGATVVDAASRGVVPLLVDEEQIPEANGYVLVAETAGQQFVGPAAGGAVFAWARAVPFLGDAVSYLGSALLLRRVFPEDAQRPVPSSSLARDIAHGVRWFLGHRGLRYLAVAITTFAFCQAMVLAVMVLYATRHLHLHAIGYGLLLAVAAVGDVLAGIVGGRIQNRLGAYRSVLLAGVLAGVSYLLLSQTGLVVLAGLVLAIESAAAAFGNIATMSIRHRLIPSQRFGLVNNAFRSCVVGVVPAGALVGGLVADTSGVRAAFIAAGCLQLVVITLLAYPLRILGHGTAKAD